MKFLKSVLQYLVICIVEGAKISDEPAYLLPRQCCLMRNILPVSGKGNCW
jgi:hypothetical protein